jgi:hypothetical protein
MSTLTLKQLWNVSDSPLIVMDSQNGKILAQSYNPTRYPGLGSRPVVMQYACDEKSVGIKGDSWTHNYIHVSVGV